MFYSLLLSFWTLSIVRISTNRKHNVSETGSVSVFRRGGGGTYSREKPKACLSTGDARTKEVMSVTHHRQNPLECICILF
jgi:hypothetical protein